MGESMERILSLVLIAFSAVGSAFSHSHECCHEVGVGERAHMHFNVASVQHSHVHLSHRHEHEHPADDKELSGQEDHHDPRAATSHHRTGETGVSCGCLAHCSECDHVIWFPEQNRFLPESKAPLQAVILQAFLADGVLATDFLSLRRLTFSERCSSRYAEPIYLRHSALLL
jgi:hypothetical protein